MSSIVNIQEFFQVSAEEARVIERKTQKQSASSTWHEEHQLRLTASSFGDICHRTIRRNNDKLCASLYQPTMLHTPPIIHGKTHETDAIKSFRSITGLNVENCGLFVCLDEPYLAATPDGLVGVSHVLEVKCPYRGRNQKVTVGPAFPFLDTENGELCLKKTHKYFDQVQGQMAITGCKLAYFVVFTFVDTAVIEVRLSWISGVTACCQS